MGYGRSFPLFLSLSQLHFVINDVMVITTIVIIIIVIVINIIITNIMNDEILRRWITQQGSASSLYRIAYVVSI